MLLWTRNMLLRWYRKQILTIDFFGKLLYMGLSIMLSLVALFMVWLPLQDTYDCLFSGMDRSSDYEAHAWKDWIFMLIAFFLLSSAVSQTDICIRSSRVDEKGMPRRLESMASKIVRLLCLLWQVLRHSHYFTFPYYLLTCIGMRQPHDCTEDEFDSDSDLCDSQEEPIKCSRPPTPKTEKQSSVSTCCSPSCTCLDSGTDSSDRPKKATKQKSEYSTIISTSEMLYRCIAPRGEPCHPPPRTGRACAGLKQGEDLDAASTKSGDSYAGSISRSLKSVIDSTSALLSRCILPWATSSSQKDQDLQNTKRKGSCKAKYRAQNDNQSDDSQGSHHDDEDDAEKNSGMLTSSSISEDKEADSDCSHLHSVSEAMTSSPSVNKSKVVARQEKGKHKPWSMLSLKSIANSISSSQRSIYDSTSIMLKKCFMPLNPDADMTQDVSKKRKPQSFDPGYRRNKNTSDGGGDDSDSQADHSDSQADHSALSSTARSSQEDRASGSGSTHSTPRSMSLTSTSSSLQWPHDQQRGNAKAAGFRNSEKSEELARSDSSAHSEDANSSTGTSSVPEQGGSKKARRRSASLGQSFTMILRPRVRPRQATQSSSLYHSNERVTLADPPHGRRPFYGTGKESGSQRKRTVVVENRPKSSCKNSSQTKRR